jgi:hypothetical protein
VDEIDDQHKEIFRRINGLLDSCRQGKGKEDVGKVINFLDDYVVTHFGREEKYVIDNSFPARQPFFGSALFLAYKPPPHVHGGLAEKIIAEGKKGT